MHILSLVTDNNPSWISGREENGSRKYFIIKNEKCGTRPVSNLWPLDLWTDTYLQSDTLLTAQCGPATSFSAINIIITLNIWPSSIYVLHTSPTPPIFIHLRNIQDSSYTHTSMYLKAEWKTFRIMIGKPAAELKTFRILIGKPAAELKTFRILIGKPPAEWKTFRILIGKPAAEWKTFRILIGKPAAELKTFRILIGKPAAEWKTFRILIGKPAAELKTFRIMIGKPAAEWKTFRILIGKPAAEWKTFRILIGKPADLHLQLSKQDISWV